MTLSTLQSFFSSPAWEHARPYVYGVLAFVLALALARWPGFWVGKKVGRGTLGLLRLVGRVLSWGGEGLRYAFALRRGDLEAIARSADGPSVSSGIPKPVPTKDTAALVVEARDDIKQEIKQEFGRMARQFAAISPDAVRSFQYRHGLLVDILVRDLDAADTAVEELDELLDKIRTTKKSLRDLGQGFAGSLLGEASLLPKQPPTKHAILRPVPTEPLPPIESSIAVLSSEPAPPEQAMSVEPEVKPEPNQCLPSDAFPEGTPGVTS